LNHVSLTIHQQTDETQPSRKILTPLLRVLNVS
jgi:hypothetical protein